MNSRWLCLVSVTLSLSCGQVPAFGESPQVEWQGDLAPITQADWNDDRAAHLLERAGFGGTPEEIEKLAAMTPAAAVDYLVDYESIDVSHLPEFEESPIYPNDHKYIHITKMAGPAMATGRAYGISAVQEGELPLQPGVNEYSH